MFREEDWMTNALKVCGVVRELLGDNLRWNQSGDYSAHPVWRFGHPPDFDVSPVLPVLRDRLDSLGWQIVTTTERTPDDGKEQFVYLVTAPLLAVEGDTIYHAAPVRVIPNILRDGLLPGDEARSLTKFPDTYGKIHGSLKLTTRPGEGDGAAFWVKHFEERFGEPFGVLAAGLTGLPTGARVYRDTHSHWGVIIDRVDSITPQRLREVRPVELTPDQTAA